MTRNTDTSAQVKVTEDDLRAAVMDDLRAMLPVEMGPDEFSIAMVRDELHLSQSQAESLVTKAIENGTVIRLDVRKVDPHTHRPVITFKRVKT